MDKNHVLVLNTDAQPMSISPLSTLSWKDAITIVWQDNVDVLHYYEDWFVHSPSTAFQVPSVIMARSWVNAGRTVKYNKQNLCLRDEYTCSYCHEEFSESDLTQDHVLPKSKGGKTTWTNIVMACQKCNTEKSDSTHMKPKYVPYKPTYFELSEKRKKRPLYIPHISWNLYLGWPEELVKIKKVNKGDF